VLTATFLRSTTKNDAAADTVSVTPLMNWFRGDFDGKNSTDNFLREYGIIPDDAKPKISYRSYDWTLSLGHFGSDV
jgi:hypothetical protein